MREVPLDPAGRAVVRRQQFLAAISQDREPASAVIIALQSDDCRGVDVCRMPSRRSKPTVELSYASAIIQWRTASLLGKLPAFLPLKGQREPRLISSESLTCRSSSTVRG